MNDILTLDVSSMNTTLGDLSPPMDPLEKKLVDHAIGAIREWSHVADTACVITKTGWVEKLFTKLMAETPIANLWCGLKTRLEDEPYHDREKWRSIAVIANAVASMTGCNECVLDSESALKKFYNGEEDIDFGDLMWALRPLRDSRVRFYWYLPSVLSSTDKYPTRLNRSIELMTTVAEAVPGSVLLNGDAGGRREWYLDPGIVAQRRKSIEVAKACGCTMMDIVYVRPDGWMYDRDGIPDYRCYDVREALDGTSFTSEANIQGYLSDNRRRVVYPGAHNCGEVAAAWLALVDGRGELL